MEIQVPLDTLLRNKRTTCTNLHELTRVQVQVKEEATQTQRRAAAFTEIKNGQSAMRNV